MTRLRVSRLLALASLLSSVVLASAAPVERRELVTVESGLAVDPIGGVRSVAHAATGGAAYSASTAGWREREAPAGVGWGVYDPPLDGSHTSMSEAALARALQDEIDREVARLSDLDTPTAAGLAAARDAVAAISADHDYQ